MRNIKFKYVFKHITTGSIEVKKYSLNQLENTLTKFLSPVFDFLEYELLGRNQYTGLKDNDGVEIYEGDILNIPICNDNENFLHIIKWENETATFILEESDGSMKWYFDDLPYSTGKVIGNIHENPELISS